MSNPQIPVSPRFHTRMHHGRDQDEFLCGDGVWRAISVLKQYDLVRPACHFADDCAKAARAAWWDSPPPDNPFRVLGTSAAWAAWGALSGIDAAREGEEAGK